MPGGDGGGPQGAGQMTGRRAGYCKGIDIPDVENGGVDIGKRGGRRGGGFVAGNGASPRGQHGNRFQFRQTGLTGWLRAGMVMNPVADENSREALRTRAETLQAELDHINTLLKQSEDA